MSSVRMCDKCGNIFSELADGWQTFEGTTVRRDDDGGPRYRSVRMDACPGCAIGVGPMKAPTPRLAAPIEEEED